ncbi:MAG: SH3 domain-containing protein [Alphaproteobacteria bacterium]|nr:SH3 domain-containing protein [Alphaproteobacteria bacterium]
MSSARALASLAAVAALAVSLSLPAHALTLDRGADTAAVVLVAAKAGDTVTVSAKTANLRSGPSAKSKKVAGLAKGTKLQVVEVTKGGWLKVKGPQGDGYVSGKLVK